MKFKFVALMFAFLFLVVSSMFFVYAGRKMTIEADIFPSYSSEPMVRVQVPVYVYVGQIRGGEETNKTKVYINNTGNTDIIVTPQLADSSETIFSNLYFARRTTEPYEQIGDWDFNMTKPSEEGGFRADYFYMKLDLRNMTILQNMTGHKADVIFWAVEQ